MARPKHGGACVRGEAVCVQTLYDRYLKDEMTILVSRD